VSFGVRTNAIFQEAVGAALDLEIDNLRLAGGRFDDREVARVFGGDRVVVRELARLRDANASQAHFDLGAYHNRLLYALLPDQLEALHDVHAGQAIEFGGGRYLVRGIDVDSLMDALFGDTDFLLPKDVVNAFGGGEKSVLGMDDGVFGVANGLRPHESELQLCPAPRSAFESIVELTAVQETELRRRHRTAPGAVWHAVAAMGWVYRRGEVFPFWPAWLDQDAAGA
jgi:hypothetical protein